jgi:radical SAM/Cys-rich protein
MADFMAAHKVEIVASLPCYSQDNVDKQRGDGVFEASIRALKKLNTLGYGKMDSGLVLNLVYNPQGPSLPPPQVALEADYKRHLDDKFNIVFNQLFTITNMPIQRFGSTLISKGLFNSYMTTLRAAHRDDNLEQVMCRSLLSIDWQGYVYDCDFNQQLGLALHGKTDARLHITEATTAQLDEMPIRVADHCYGCTAGQGSSCGGALEQETTAAAPACGG